MFHPIGIMHPVSDVSRIVNGTPESTAIADS
jgi:hypothetical protein